MSIAIQIDVPYLPLEEYAKRTGQSYRAVKDQAELPPEKSPIIVHQFVSGGKRYVNMVKMHERAASQLF